MISNNDEQRLYNRAISLWGEKFQIGMIHEELGKLSSAINKYQRGRIRRDDLIFEIADVIIMTRQLMVILRFPYDCYSLEFAIQKKLKRLEKLVKKGELLK